MKLSCLKKRKVIEDAELKLSKSSLKTNSYETLLNNLDEHVQQAPKVLNFYGSIRHSRERFKMIQKKQRFFSKISEEIFCAVFEMLPLLIDSSRFEFHFGFPLYNLYSRVNK